MSRLTKIIEKQRKSGKGVLSSVTGGIRERLREKFDWKRMFNQRGLLVAMFPKLKTYDALAKVKGESKSRKLKITSLERVENPILKKIDKNTKIFAVNSQVLPIMMRDMNVMRQNSQILVKKLGKESSRETDIHFRKQHELEKLYEAEILNMTAPVKVEEGKKKGKKKFGWVNLLGLAGAAGIGYLVVDFFKKQEDSIIKKIYTTVSDDLNDMATMSQKFFNDQFDRIIKPKADSALTEMKTSLNKTTEKIDKAFTFENILELLTEDGRNNLAKDYEKDIQEIRDKLRSQLAEISIIPEAQAAIKPSSVLSDTDESPSSLQALVSLGESGRGPDAYNAINYTAKQAGWKNTTGKEISEMTLQEVLNMQRSMLNRGAKSSAVGKYQMLRGTLEMGISELDIPLTQKFDAQTQELLFKEFLIKTKRKDLYAFLSGQSDDLEAAMLDLAKEFASMPVPTAVQGASGRRLEPGQSYYQGIAGNQANKTIRQVGEALIMERESRLGGTPVTIGEPTVSPPLAYNSTTSSAILDSSSQLSIEEAASKGITSSPVVVMNQSPDIQNNPYISLSKDMTFDPAKELLDFISD